MLFNKRLLKNEINKFEFPAGYDFTRAKKIIDTWQKAIKDGNYDKTKETQVQSAFLNKFFNVILGYAEMHDNPDAWNLINEAKTEFDGTKADGALGFFTKDDKSNITRAVIELKDAKTPLDQKQSSRKDYDNPVSQAFSYSSKFDRCDWIIVSNFKEIRLYHKDRGQGFYEKIEILNLHNEEEFKRFYFLLCKENLLHKERQALLDRLVKDTSKQEEDISKEFYKHFKELRQDLFNHLTENNPEIDKKCLLEKTQKLLDRMIFVFFCEDSYGLLPANITNDVYQLGIRSRERSDQRVWREFKNLFQDIDEGRYDIDPPINAYNGGLFANDEVLNNLVVKDDIWAEIVKLSGYDFESDLNVNILGHIFEQSLSDLEKIKSELDGQEADSKKSKRKKDGIFYTPEYITRYIIEQTVGEYLKENPEKLETIKILDPACGSGAFLNQAHTFLQEQHKVRFEEQIMGKSQLGLMDRDLAKSDKAILLNNIFGVDLNEESVEITKLALWLKTAKKTEPLQNLDNNIKCGNSLIDDPEIAGDKAFNWHKEFLGIFREKELKAFHVTWATHNSRYSERMKEYKVKTGEPVLFNEQDEVLITQFIAQIVKEDNLRILAYNICQDHVHCVLVCEEVERDRIIQKLKAVSARKYNIHVGRTIPPSSDDSQQGSMLPCSEKERGETQNHLWAQKYNYNLIENEAELENVLHYVTYNRLKHKLSEQIGKGACSLVQSMLTPIEEAFTPQYAGGFDVVIGNPPYVFARGQNFTQEIKNYYYDKFSLVDYQVNTYLLFIEKSYSLIKQGGYFGFIIPNNWLTIDTFKKLREFIIKNTSELKIINLKDKIFEDANVDTCLLLFKKFQPNNVLLAEFVEKNIIIKNHKPYNEILNNENLILNINLSENNELLLKKINTNSYSLVEKANVSTGLKAYQIGKGHPVQTEDIKEERKFHSLSKIDKTYVKYLEGKDVNRYLLTWAGEYLSYGDWLAEPRKSVPFNTSRILVRQIPSQPPYCINAIYTDDHCLNDINSMVIFDFNANPLFILSILNSKIISFWFINTFDKLQRGLFPQFKVKELKLFPIPEATPAQQESLAQKADKMLELNKILHESAKQALDFIQTKYDLKKIPQKLEKFWQLGANPFMEELKKAIKKQGVATPCPEGQNKGAGSLARMSEQEELIQWYKEKQTILQNIENQINALDHQIDAEVYGLYGLTDEEIRIIEGE